MTYLLLNFCFMVFSFLVLRPTKNDFTKGFWVVLGGVVALTAVFDPIIVALDIVAYDPAKTLGLNWFGAPIEDFFYAIYAVALVRLLWLRLEKRGV